MSSKNKAFVLICNNLTASLSLFLPVRPLLKKKKKNPPRCLTENDLALSDTYQSAHFGCVGQKTQFKLVSVKSFQESDNCNIEGWIFFQEWWIRDSAVSAHQLPFSPSLALLSLIPAPSQMAFARLTHTFPSFTPTAGRGWAWSRPRQSGGIALAASGSHACPSAYRGAQRNAACSLAQAQFLSSNAAAAGGGIRLSQTTWKGGAATQRETSREWLRAVTCRRATAQTGRIRYKLNQLADFPWGRPLNV